jgi:hypothetical protein
MQEDCGGGAAANSSAAGHQLAVTPGQLAVRRFKANEKQCAAKRKRHTRNSLKVARGW